MYISNNPINQIRRAMIAEEKASQKVNELKRAATEIEEEEATKVDIAETRTAPAKVSTPLDGNSARKMAEEARQAILSNPSAAMSAQCNTTNDTAWRLLA